MSYDSEVKLIRILNKKAEPLYYNNLLGAGKKKSVVLVSEERMQVHANFSTLCGSLSTLHLDRP